MDESEECLNGWKEYVWNSDNFIVEIARRAFVAGWEAKEKFDTANSPARDE